MIDVLVAFVVVTERLTEYCLCVLKTAAVSDSAYAYSLTTFAPSGKLVQIEHALRAVQSGATALGVKCNVPQHTASCDSV